MESVRYHLNCNETCVRTSTRDDKSDVAKLAANDNDVSANEKITTLDNDDSLHVA